MTEDDKKAIEHAEKRLRKLMRRYDIADAVKEIGKAMQEFRDIECVKDVDTAVPVVLLGGDVALAVFSVVKNKELHDLLNQDGPDSNGDTDEEWAIEPESFKRTGDVTWPKCAEAIDRFRDKVSVYYGFDREAIVPVSISDVSDPLLESTFTVLGIEYKVSDAVLTCVGEVQ